VRCDCAGEELSCCADVAFLPDVHINHLTMLINSTVHVPPHTSDFDIRFTDEPAVSDLMATWSSRVNEEWCEALNPPVQRDMINLDIAFSEKFFQVTIGKNVTKIPTNRQHDHFWRKPETIKGRRDRNRNVTTTTAAIHSTSLPSPASMQQCPYNT
jgi:hypothetical protein